MNKSVWFVASVVLLAACGSGPSKADVLTAIQRDVKEDGSCTLPLDFMGAMKLQYTTKGMCIPREGSAKAEACLNALVAAGLTTPMPTSYMAEWPDEVATRTLSEVPAYDRRARSLIFKSCGALTGDLREGRFACATAKADAVTKVTTKDENHATARYTRTLGFKPEIAALEAACGGLIRPQAETSVEIEKGTSGWSVTADEKREPR